MTAKPHWTQTAEGKKKLAAAQRRSWRSGKRKGRTWREKSAPPSKNGMLVEQQIVLRLKGQETTLNLGEARQLREALLAAFPREESQ
jgi:hypothetical protein